MDKIKKILPKAFIIAIVYNILVLIMMIDSIETQITVYCIGLAIIGVWLYKLINLIIDKIKGGKDKNEKR